MFFAIGFCYLFFGIFLVIHLRTRKQYQKCLQQVKYLQKHVQDIAPIINSVNLHCQTLEQTIQTAQNSTIKNTATSTEQKENYSSLRKQVIHIEQKLNDLKTSFDCAIPKQETSSDIMSPSTLPQRQEVSWGMLPSANETIDNRNNLNTIAENMMRQNLEWLKSTDLPM